MRLFLAGAPKGWGHGMDTGHRLHLWNLAGQAVAWLLWLRSQNQKRAGALSHDLLRHGAEERFGDT